jgi:tetratricopeptide (TPR) repeat protein
MDKLAQRAYLNAMPNRDASILGGFYSVALDYWGVQAQKSGHWAAAAAHFHRALDLNRANRAAQVNLECNQALQANRRPARIPDKPLDELLEPFRSWDQLMSQSGPFDDPIYCQQAGLQFAKARLFRQAAQQFAQAKALVVDDPAPSLWLARMDILHSLPDEALRVLKEVHDHAAKAELARTNAVDLMVVDMAAYLTKHDTQGAEAAVRWAMAKYPEDDTLLATAARVYLIYGAASNAVPCIRGALSKHPEDEDLLVMASHVYTRAKLYPAAAEAIKAAIDRHSADDVVKQYMLATAAEVQINAGAFSNAVVWLDRQLKLSPNNPPALISRGYAFLQLGELDAAVSSFTQAIDIETNNRPDLRIYARLNRAITYLRAGKLDPAQKDYETLKAANPSGYAVYYGLQEIAYRKKDTNAAVLNCEEYLKYAPTNTDEYKQIRSRLNDLRPHPR